MAPTKNMPGELRPKITQIPQDTPEIAGKQAIGRRSTDRPAALSAWRSIF
jgi:hypothetical protein